MNTQISSPATHLITGIVLFLAGAVAWVFVDPYLPSSLSNTQKGYKTGFTAAQTLVENSSLGNFFRTETDVRTVSGTVTAINGNRLTIHSESVSNPFDGPAINDRTIIIDTNTKVIKLTAKDSKTIRAEFDAFIKAQQTSQANTAALTAVSREPYIQTTVNASSLHVGDSLVVTAGENIKTASSFTAIEIRIQPQLP